MAADAPDRAAGPTPNVRTDGYARPAAADQAFEITVMAW
jgi:hypothetical protein